jgi:hypothetical protein
MPSKNIKYPPIVTYVGEERFDSVYESQVFRLLRHYSYRDIDGERYKLFREVPILVKPAGNVFSAKKWKCDFTLRHPKLGTLHIEAKGFLTDLWLHQLELLETTDPMTFNRVRVVTSTKEVKSALARMSSRVHSILALDCRIADSDFWRLGNEDSHIS